MIKKIVVALSILVLNLTLVSYSYSNDEAQIKEAYQQMMNAYRAYSDGSFLLSDDVKTDQLLREYIAACDNYKNLLKKLGTDESAEIAIVNPEMTPEDLLCSEANENYLRSYINYEDAKKNNASEEEIQKLYDEYINCGKIKEKLLMDKMHKRFLVEFEKAYETTGKILNCQPVPFDHETKNKYRNTCGQYAVNVTLNYFGIKEDYKTTVENMNTVGSLTAPDHIISYLENKNVECQPKNKAGIEDLVKSIDAGHLAMCYVSVGGLGPHWVTIIGYDKNEAGDISNIIFLDGDCPVHTPVNNFLTQWVRPTYIKGRINELLNHNYYMIEVKGVNPDLTSARNYIDTAMDDQFLSGVNTMALGMNQNIAGFGYIKSFSDAKDKTSNIDLRKVNYPVFALGAVETISAVPNKLIFGLSGHEVQKAGTALQKFGNSRTSTGDFIHDTITNTAKLSGAVLTPVGNCLTMIGNYISKAEEMLFMGAKKKLNFNW